MKTKFIAALILTAALSPALAFASQRETHAHERPVLFHDRTPHARVHDAQPHH